jgi:hypothetical protein
MSKTQDLLEKLVELSDKLKGLSLNALYLFICFALIGASPWYVPPLLARAAQVVEVDIAGVKISFSKESLARQVAKEGPPTTPAEMLHATIHQLSEEEIIRLLNTGLLGDTCEFPRAADAKVREDYQRDQRLSDFALIKMESKPKTLAQVMENMRTAKRDGKAWTNGQPSFCYKAELTILGRNVVTALINSLSTAFPTRVALN